MSGLVWETVQHEFAFDGAWRDIYVFGTDMADWQVMVDNLRANSYDLSYFRDHQPSTLPAAAADAFPLSEECDRLLSVRFAGVVANCHFFTAAAIEFDIDPREIKGQDQLDALVGFMQCLADATGREAVLTPENGSSIVIFQVQPR